jgi:glycosyltransferase involved in cell wall biosynthesis
VDRVLNLIQLTPGAGTMYCGNCLRDNALVGGLRRLGHQVVMVPLYLPLTLDQANESASTPLFFNGINVYLEQNSALFRRAPAWVHRWLDSPRLLRWAARRSASTRAADLGELTLSMLRGESGRQAREIETLVDWLKTQPHPDALCFSNAMLLGMARRLQAAFGTPIICSLQGEDTFLDALAEPWRTECWRELATRAAEVDLFIAPSRYYADLMGTRLGLRANRVQVLYNGLDLAKFDAVDVPPGSSGTRTPPTIGFFARMCPEKGLDTLVDAFLRIRQTGRVPGLRLRIGGSCGPAEAGFVESLRQRLLAAGAEENVDFCPNLSFEEKVRFLRSLSVFSVPALYGEAFGLYLLEAWAAGVPTVQPRSGAFPELLAATGGGLTYDDGRPEALAEALSGLLLDSSQARTLGQAGRLAVQERFSLAAMSQGFVRLASGLKPGDGIAPELRSSSSKPEATRRSP